MKRSRFWLIVFAFLLFILLALSIQAGYTKNFEGWAYRAATVPMSPVLTTVVKGITHLGDTASVTAFCLLLILIPKSRKTIALPVSSTVILSAVLNTILKEFFARERPDILRLINETSYSFPSGHAMNNAALYTMLFMLVVFYIKSKPWKIGLTIVCVFLPLAIGLSRIYLGVHYAGDVAGGWIIGFALSMLVYNLWHRKKYSNRIY